MAASSVGTDTQTATISNSLATAGPNTTGEAPAGAAESRSSNAPKVKPKVKQRSRAELAERAKRITEAELAIFRSRTPKSQVLNTRAWESMPAGVASSFQYYAPHPVMADRAAGSRIWDMDGNEYVDFNMGFGALFSGHSHPILAAALHEQIGRGTLFVTPCETNALAAELLKERFGLDLFRFTNSGTEATHDAIRLARAFTGRDRIVKVEGGYHGHHDEVMISMKPSLEEAGDPNSPNSVPSTKGIPASLVREVSVVQYNDPVALERELAKGDVAAFIVEPVMENIGICLPVNDYLTKVREITQRYGTMLIFDEVKTGITAGFGGASGHFGVKPDLLCLAKSIGGGLPVGAFGGRADVMSQISEGQVLHLGTFNGNPLCSAAVVAVLRDICTREAIAETIEKNAGMMAHMQTIIDAYGLPAHLVQMGAKGCVTFSEKLVENYRDYKSTDFDLAYALWIWGINRGILLPPGLDEQWLVSILHTEADLTHHLEVFESFAQELTK
jgi:glutamate-1-semialdehyde 2,1-aminomutase